VGKKKRAFIRKRNYGGTEKDDPIGGRYHTILSKIKVRSSSLCRRRESAKKTKDAKKESLGLQGGGGEIYTGKTWWESVPILYLQRDDSPSPEEELSMEKEKNIPKRRN